MEWFDYVNGEKYCLNCFSCWEDIQKSLFQSWKNESLFSVPKEHLFYGKWIRKIPQKELKKIIEDKKENYEYGLKYWNGLERKRLDNIKSEVKNLEGCIHDNSSK